MFVEGEEADIRHDIDMATYSDGVLQRYGPYYSMIRATIVHVNDETFVIRWAQSPPDASNQAPFENFVRARILQALVDPPPEVRLTWTGDVLGIENLESIQANLGKVAREEIERIVGPAPSGEQAFWRQYVESLATDKELATREIASDVAHYFWIAGRSLVPGKPEVTSERLLRKQGRSDVRVRSTLFLQGEPDGGQFWRAIQLSEPGVSNVEIAGDDQAKDRADEIDPTTEYRGRFEWLYDANSRWYVHVSTSHESIDPLFGFVRTDRNWIVIHSKWGDEDAHPAEEQEAPEE